MRFWSDLVRRMIYIMSQSKSCGLLGPFAPFELALFLRYLPMFGRVALSKNIACCWLKVSGTSGSLGGGTIAIMVMTLCGRTIHRAIATASGIGTLIAIPTTIGFAIIGLKETGLPWGSLGYINIPGTLAIASMSMLTAPLGVAAAHSLPAGPLKKIFGVYLLIIGLLMLRNGLNM